MDKWDCEERGKIVWLDGTKLKGNGQVSWCGINDIIAGVQEMVGLVFWENIKMV